MIGRIDDAELKAAYEQAKRNLDDLTTPASFAEAEQAVAEADVAIYNARQGLEYLISSDVYYWEQQVAAAEETLQAAQTDGGSSPTAEQKQKIDEATTALSRAQTNLEAAQLRYNNEYVPDTFTYTLNGGSTATVSVTVTCVYDPPVADDAGIHAPKLDFSELRVPDNAYLQAVAVVHTEQLQRSLEKQGMKFRLNTSAESVKPAGSRMYASSRAPYRVYPSLSSSAGVPPRGRRRERDRSSTATRCPPGRGGRRG